MLIGVPREIKVREYRVGMTPGSVREAIHHHGHRVIVESGAGDGIGCDDAAYRAVGAEVVDSAEEVFARAEMIVKVKEPQPQEIARLHAGQLLFTYLHLAPDPAQTQALLASGVTAIAYETVTDSRGGLPLLAPMSEVAGRMATQVGAGCLEKERGGSGILLGGVPGVAAGRVTVLGGGTVGTQAARMALGLGADVTVLDKSSARLSALDDLYGPRLKTLFATLEAVEQAVQGADLVIGAVLVPGAAAPKLVTRGMLDGMRPGSVLVDVAIDQGGCFETSRPTTHDQPTYVEQGMVHYAVTNMPGAVPRTSTQALNNATLPVAMTLADKGWRQALRDDPHLRAGLNLHDGQLTCAPVAEAQGLPYVAAQDVV
ncbi:alanine dehydrogenase [Magnetospira thiophila]